MTTLTGTGGGSGGTVTLSNLIERVRTSAGDKAHRDTLNGALDASTTSITLTTGTEISAQSRIDIDLETMFVSAKASATAGTIVRAYSGTTAATHANGAEVLSGFRFSRDEYRRAINKALGAIGYAFGKPTWDTTQSYTGTKHIIEVPAAARRVFMVGHKPTGYTDLKNVPFKWMKSLPTGISSTGKGVRLTSAHPSSGTVYIGYEAVWSTLSGLADTLDSEFPSDAMDLIELGAHAYLLDGESFEYVSFSMPHAKVDAFAREGGPRISANQHLIKFIQRRAEVAARESILRTSWLRTGGG